MVPAVSCMPHDRQAPAYCSLTCLSALEPSPAMRETIDIGRQLCWARTSAYHTCPVGADTLPVKRHGESKLASVTPSLHSHSDSGELPVTVSRWTGMTSITASTGTAPGCTG